MPPTIDQTILDALTSTLFDGENIPQIVSRVSSVLRMCEIKREINMRAQTLAELTEAPYHLPSKTSGLKPIRILFIGKAAPEFMSVMNAFNDSDVEIVAAFTSFSAFDFLHEQTFNAVVISAIDSNESAYAITSTMRHNSKLYHVPSFALVKETTTEEQARAFENGINDIIIASAPSAEIRGRILELAGFHRMQDHVRSLYSNIGGRKCIDLETGLFNADFFECHIRRHINSAMKRDIPLTLSVMKPVAVSAEFGAANIETEASFMALRQIAGMINNMLRIQDCTARISKTQFALIFPDKTPQDVAVIIERIREIIDCTAFESSGQAFIVRLDVSTKLLHTPKKITPQDQNQMSA